MPDRQQITAATLTLIHQNQVALGESIQLISAWFQRHGVSEITSSLQVHMQLLVKNSQLINSRLDGLLVLAVTADPQSSGDAG